MKKKTVHYVDNKKFLQAILDYQEEKRNAVDVDKVKISNYIGECILKIATNLSTKPCFSSYSFKDEMIGDSLENCFLYFDQFDPTKTQNPFAYFTQVIYFAFIRRIQKEEKNRYIKYKSFYDVFGNGYLDEETGAPIKTYENIDDFIVRYEIKLAEKKRKANEKKGLEKYYDNQESGENTTSNSKLDFSIA